jgi:hypothetical protein
MGPQTQYFDLYLLPPVHALCPVLCPPPNPTGCLRLYARCCRSYVSERLKDRAPHHRITPAVAILCRGLCRNPAFPAPIDSARPVSLRLMSVVQKLARPASTLPVYVAQDHSVSRSVLRAEELSRQRSRVRVSSSPPFFLKTYNLAAAQSGCCKGAIAFASASLLFSRYSDCKPGGSLVYRE